MDKDLWNKILEYDLDHPVSEYGFSTRLANENYWTKNFTEKAIVEYKKFMYLAATSDLMVSPSEIIDNVWHQHLIFTQSYQEFCDLMGKQIQHVPSTHNKDEFEKFNQAKERTKKLYHNTFGEQPADIWNYAGMYESLKLDKAMFKIRTFIHFSILIFISLIIPIYYLLRPVYVKIGNPDFMIGFTLLSMATFFLLETFNKQYLAGLVRTINGASFLFDLQPSELVYLKTQKLSNVVTGAVNHLIKRNVITVNRRDGSLEKTPVGASTTLEEYQVLDSLGKTGRAQYSNVLNVLVTKPVFWNTANCMDAFKKYFIKSKKFGKLFYLNTAVLLTLLLLGFTRFSTGLLNLKPVEQIGISLIILIVCIISFLTRLTHLACAKTIPEYYKNEILEARKDPPDGQWQYFLLGSSALAAAFVPLVTIIEKHDSSTGSCGSSCGSSCSSCGGCGGD